MDPPAITSGSAHGFHSSVHFLYSRPVGQSIFSQGRGPFHLLASCSAADVLPALCRFTRWHPMIRVTEAVGVAGGRWALA
jgi:hypothetical protein